MCFRRDLRLHDNTALAAICEKANAENAQISAMFLTKDLLIDWRLGERYFMQQLIDGDFASNNGG